MTKIRKTSLLATTVVLGVSGLAVAGTVSPPTFTPDDGAAARIAERAQARAAGVDQLQALTGAFSALHGPPPSAEERAGLQKELSTAGVPSSFGLVEPSARLATTTDGHAIWLIPGKSGMCLATDDREGWGITCGTADDALAGRLALVQSSTTGPSTVFGAAPDASTRITTKADGAADLPVTPSNNVYVTTRNDLSGVRIETPDSAVLLPVR